MNTQHYIPTFPLGFHYNSETQANTMAMDYSTRYPDQFIYVIFSTTTGKYRHDYIGLKFSDEKILSTFKQGHKTL